MLKHLIQARIERALQQALALGDKDALQKAIRKGANINNPCILDNGPARPPIRHALNKADAECLQVLLEADLPADAEVPAVLARALDDDAFLRGAVMHRQPRSVEKKKT